ncbi:hypothetical protein Amet_0714 [Alkaliphilus metalliredigens QYMF]|uniref:Uncharacterized protein n=1 Tax=Alkaliphilus metalliredigens (strain QYMF) TaxID=293826 RepID=A6TL71_ALKMQ|nr:aspartyl-phosphate phosphatase Spo0E family protein [Alkaliphilus metalliredigens]ABR46939.1 hypothetical protein Amet_0714 [Alkaliphilus metalliredigens QYMF]
MNHINNLKDRIEELKEQLSRSLDEGRATYDIVDLSQELDELIVEYYLLNNE